MTDVTTRTVGTIDDVNENQLNTLVEQAEQGSIFHRHEWLAAHEAAIDHDPYHVVVTKGNNPVAFLPNFVRDVPVPTAVAERALDALAIRMVSPPKPGYGGPVFVGNERETIDRLFSPSRDGHDARFLLHRIQGFDSELVRYSKQLYAMGYEPRMQQSLHFLSLQDDWETIRENMDAERRKALRKATDQDHEVTVAPLADDLDRTYEMYVANMHRIDGEILPRKFFQELADRIGDRVQVFRASVDGRDVGRYVHVLDDESGVLHHWLTAIADESDFQYYPSELLHGRAIPWGIERGYDRYSFGISSPHFDDSIFRFKDKFGATAEPLFRWEKGLLPGMWHAYDAGRAWYLRKDLDGDLAEG
ncbi:GNAT family N-acetyltransferase [Halomicrobium urmianum]|uniref:GNAT family N-acetyltransferase n=1 Tax=Halomicrobium urmianum TaxID=1586233 RepID=UPI001CD9CCD6|nr:GNAT family N-acetyltransferase [Halomicrobium urmianum]